MTLEILKKPTLILFNELRLSGGKEALTIIGKSKEYGSFKGILNFTMYANFTAYVNGTALVIQSVYVRLDDLSIDIYGCDTQAKCEEIKK